MPAPGESARWFREAAFGIFVHWGLYSIHGRDVWSMYLEQTPLEEYDRLADRFAPRRYDATEWAALAKDAGARYTVMCTRQHDGFSLFDTRVSDFSSVKRVAKRDLVAEYAEAVRKAGLGVGFYYSLLDWRWPAYFSGPDRDRQGWSAFVEYVHAQVRELCTQYGRVDVLWYDGGWPYGPHAWRAAELNAMVRSLQPHILINNRSGPPEDFDTPEQRIEPSPPGRFWETCMTTNDHWGFVPADTHWKSTTQLIHSLVRCASRAGNYLLNVGPDPDGLIPPEAVCRLREVGRWLRANGEAVYGTDDASALRRNGMVHAWPTLRGNVLYVHVQKWPGTQLVLGNLASRVVAARLVHNHAAIPFRQEGSRVFLTGLPQYAPDPHDTVVAVECEDAPRPVDRFA
ncbi:MAG TPA: alpha-L-fucosidase [Chloroflexota bacterium]|nr:alpha-L-fucosidase [Chloroflexota bacterium]